jgi:phosphohistidine phosphatase SixA
MRLLLSCLLMGLLAACAKPPAPTAADPQAALVAALRQGGYVIYLRHAETAPTPEPAVRDFGDCSWQRNLNAQGRAQAVALGAQLRALGISAATVESSPFCRARETAELVFGGEPKVNPDLFYHVSQTPAEVAAADAKLQARFARPPPAGGNVVLVGHAPTMRDISGVVLPEGQGAIVKPAGDGTFLIVGRLGAGGISAAGGS